jgi:hypothetical protein
MQNNVQNKRLPHDYVSQINQMQVRNGVPYYQPSVDTAGQNENVDGLPLMTQKQRVAPQYQQFQGYNPYQMTGFNPYPGFSGSGLNNEGVIMSPSNIFAEPITADNPHSVKSQRKIKKGKGRMITIDDHAKDENSPISKLKLKNRDDEGFSQERKERGESSSKEKKGQLDTSGKQDPRDENQGSYIKQECRDENQGSYSKQERRDETQGSSSKQDRRDENAGSYIKQDRRDENQGSSSKQERRDENQHRERKRRNEDGRATSGGRREKEADQQHIISVEEDGTIDILDVPTISNIVKVKSIPNILESSILQQLSQQLPVGPITNPPVIVNPTFLPLIPSIAENERVSAIHALGILESGDHPRLNKITQMTLRLLGGSCCVLSIVDVDRVLWTSSSWNQSSGASPQPPKEEPRYEAFCSWVVQDETARGITILDTKTDPRCTHMRAKFGLEFYVGVPLMTADKMKIGALSIRGPARTQFSVVDMNILFEMAGWASGEMDTISQQRSLDFKHQLSDARLKINIMVESAKDTERDASLTTLQKVEFMANLRDLELLGMQ